MIDAVITWVDGSRPGFEDELAHAVELYRYQYGTAPDPRAVSPNRFRDNNCLRYALRSIWRNAPWVDRIFIVTAGEWPAWLSRQHRVIQHVRHDEIFPQPAALPNFNSNAIETCLHHIKGISRHFLYLNDDIFIKQPLAFNHFQTASGTPRFSFELREIPSDPYHPTPVGAAGAYCRELLNSHFGRRPGWFETAHEPVLFDRVILEDMQQVWAIEISRTRNARLRTPQDFCSLRMYVHYAMEQARLRASQPSEIPAIRFTNTGFVNFGAPEPSLQSQLYWLAKRDHGFICINDEAGEHGLLKQATLERDTQILVGYLSRHFPEAAPWETDTQARHGDAKIRKKAASGFRRFLFSLAR